MIEGVVYGKGTLTAFVNNTQAAIKVLEARDTIALELTVAEGSACIVIETEWEDGSVTRELCNPEPETSVIETFVKVSEITVGKKSTMINWK